MLYPWEPSSVGRAWLVPRLLLSLFASRRVTRPVCFQCPRCLHRSSGAASHVLVSVRTEQEAHSCFAGGRTRFRRQRIPQ